MTDAYYPDFEDAVSLVRTQLGLNSEPSVNAFLRIAKEASSHIAMHRSEIRRMSAEILRLAHDPEFTGELRG